MTTALKHRSAARWLRPMPVAGHVVGLLLLLLPLALGRYGVAVGIEVLIFAILAMSLDVSFGYTGMPSLGHAAFFGLGTHFVVLLGVHYGISPWIGLVVGVIAAMLFAMLVGALSIRTSGVTFLMLTMAFGQLLYSISLRWRDMTGGSDGIGGLPRPSLFGVSLFSNYVMYGLTAVVFVVTYFGLRRLVSSPLGHAFVGIRENEQRMLGVGYPVRLYKLISFSIGGAVAGLAGGLYGIFNGFVSADVLHFSLSGDVLIMVIVGGAGTLVGPAFGAAVLLLAKYLISSWVESWMLVVGTIFMACVMAFRNGIYGSFLNLIAPEPASREER